VGDRQSVEAKMCYKAKQGEEIHYVDVISLYPSICKYDKFLIGHPKVYVGADCPANCLEREGIIKCKVFTSWEAVSSSTSVQEQFQADVPFVF
jgi:hypothetical protein